MAVALLQVGGEDSSSASQSMTEGPSASFWGLRAQWAAGPGALTPIRGGSRVPRRRVQLGVGTLRPSRPS